MKCFCNKRIIFQIKELFMHFVLKTYDKAIEMVGVLAHRTAFQACLGDKSRVPMLWKTASAP